MKYAIIGGTGFEDLDNIIDTLKVHTIYGDVEVYVVKSGNIEYAFLSRHNRDHSIAPHLVNYQANIMALKILKVEYVYAICAVGSCNKSVLPGQILLLSDFLDFTKSRKCTYFDGINYPLKHLEMTNPYNEDLNRLFVKYANKIDLNTYENGIYVCTEGPRFETSTEIKYYNTLGAHVVGMTSVPEVILAKELGICYSCVSYVINFCTGISKDGVTVQLESNIDPIKSSIINVILSAFSDEDINKIKCESIFV